MNIDELKYRAQCYAQAVWEEAAAKSEADRATSYLKTKSKNTQERHRLLQHGMSDRQALLVDHPNGEDVQQIVVMRKETHPRDGIVSDLQIYDVGAE